MALRARPLVIAASYLALAIAFCWPLFAVPDGLGGYDWDQHFVFYASVLKSAIEYGQPPFWNPWQCGGNVLWQNPQVALLSPVYPLALTMSLALAMKVNIVLHYWMGLVGMHLLLTRAIGLTFLPVVVYLSALFAFCGALVLHLAVGHTVFLPAFYLPWLVFFFIRALRGGLVRDMLLAGGVLALAIYNGGFHVVPMAIVAIGSLGFAAAVAGRSWKPIATVAILFAAAGALAGPRLVPILLVVNGDRFLDARSPTLRPDVMTREMLARAYTDRFQALDYQFPRQMYGWWEYGNYIGEFGLLVIVAGVLAVALRRSEMERPIGLALASTAVVLFALSLGDFSAAAPASLLAQLPVFSSLRAPSRNMIAFMLIAAATAGWAWRGLESRRPVDARLKMVVGLVCLLAAAHLGVQNQRQFTGVFKAAPLDRSFRWLDGPAQVTADGVSSPWEPNSPMLRAVMSDRVFFNCYESLQLQRTAASERPLIAGDGATIARAAFTPNRVAFAATGGSQPARVFMNQNFEYGWRSTAGPVTLDAATGMMTTTMGAGQSGAYAFWYTPPGLVAGSVLLLAALLASWLSWARRL